LENKGVKAAMLSSMQTMEEIRATEAALKNQDIKVLFVAPEKFYQLLALVMDEKNQNQKPLAMFVVYLPLLFFTSQ
jgi:superfamily II DNA helicase RecQ